MHTQNSLPLGEVEGRLEVLFDLKQFFQIKILFFYTFKDFFLQSLASANLFFSLIGSLLILLNLDATLKFP